jgi:hypothetical protein
MNDRWKSVGRWLLVSIVLVATTIAAYIATWFSLFVDRLETHWAVAARLSFPPSAVLHIGDFFVAFLIAALWVVPVVWVVGFALRARRAVILLWGFSSSLLLTAVFVWFGTQPWSRALAVVAGVALVFALVYLSVRKKSPHVLLFINIAVFVLLLAPRLIVLASEPKQPPLARKLWSVVLQKGTWQAMNTGSEYSAKRELTFAGDRVIAIFDAGFAGYERKQPLSRYRLVSLDVSNGAIRNEMEFTGHWGGMSYVFGTHAGKVLLIGPGPIKMLNPDLSPTGRELTYGKGRIGTISTDGTTLGWETFPGTTLLTTDTLQPIGRLNESSPISISQMAALSLDHYWYRDYPNDHEFVTFADKSGERLLFHGNCGFPAEFLTNDRILINGCGRIHILDTQGKAVVDTKSVGAGGIVASVSQDGSQFALEQRDERGDPSVVLYEQFIVYDGHTAKPIVRVAVDDLPEKQSWSAFSPDGHFFAVGNPDKLTLYQIP